MAMAVIRLARPAPAAIRPPSAVSSPSPSQSPSSSSLRPPAARLRLRRGVRCRAATGGDGEKGQEEGEEAEAPESMFARELRRRGMAPGAAATPAGDKEAEEGAATTEAGAAKRRVAAAEFQRGAGAAAAADGQRARSMALNSEGLEGLVPRAKLLLSLGTTFFLAFGPLILVTVSLFAGLYVYLGPSFVHDASKTSASPPPYIDPYKLLEDERLSRPSPDVF